MLGSGRPFLLEFQNPRLVPSESSIKEMERKINSSEGKLVRGTRPLIMLSVPLFLCVLCGFLCGVACFGFVLLA